jgi:hypothetical protein
MTSASFEISVPIRPSYRADFREISELAAVDALLERVKESDG